MGEYIEFIPKAGACLATTNVMERRGKVRWMWRRPSQTGADVCYIEPALVGIWDFEVGSDLELVHDQSGIHIVDIPTGRQIPAKNFCIPPRFRARMDEQ